MQVNRKRSGSFFMPKFKHKEVSEMFSDEILEKLFARPELQKFSAAEQSTLIDVFEEVLEEMEAEKNATLPEP